MTHDERVQSIMRSFGCSAQRADEIATIIENKGDQFVKEDDGTIRPVSKAFGAKEARHGSR